MRRLGFEQSAFTTTRWLKSHYEYVLGMEELVMDAWIDLTPKGWRLTCWGQSKHAIARDTLGLELVPMLAFAAAEGWI